LSFATVIVVTAEVPARVLIETGEAVTAQAELANGDVALGGANLRLELVHIRSARAVVESSLHRPNRVARGAVWSRSNCERPPKMGASHLPFVDSLLIGARFALTIDVQRGGA
jgi:hypothetical protein